MMEKVAFLLPEAAVVDLFQRCKCCPCGRMPFLKDSVTQERFVSVVTRCDCGRSGPSVEGLTLSPVLLERAVEAWNGALPRMN